jgi:hypothetical protein
MFLFGNGRVGPAPQTSYISAFSGYTDTGGNWPPVVDGSANIFVPGHIKDTGTPYRGLTLKTDAAGSIQFQRQLAHATEDVVMLAIGLDSSGNVYVTGFQYDGAAPTNTYKWVLCKYNSAGTLQWQRLISKAGGDFNYGQGDMVVTSAGDIYLGGAHNNVGTSGQNAPVVMKYDASGVLQWQYYLSGLGSDVRLYRLAFDATNNRLYGAGARVSSANRLLFRLDVAATPTLSWTLTDTGSAGDNYVGLCVAANGDIVAAAFSDPSGNHFTQLDRFTAAGAGVWRATLNNSSVSPNWLVPNYLQRDASDNFYWGGFYGDLPGAPATIKGLTWKIDTSGNSLWYRTLTPPTGGAQHLGIVPISTTSVVQTTYASGLVVLKVPADGTKTGTYSGYVYALPGGLLAGLGAVTSTTTLTPTLIAATLTDAAGSLTDSSAATSRTLINIP